jgi:mono/diheme cytochrome c family protein
MHLLPGGGAPQSAKAGCFRAEIPVIEGLFRKKSGWLAAAFFPGFFGLLITAGCNSTGYPEDLRYPQRTDPLVMESLNNAPVPTHFDKPGEFLHMLEDPSFPLLQFKEGPNYALRFPGIDPRTGKQGIADKYLTAIESGLNVMFGTPHTPIVLVGTKKMGKRQVRGISKEARNQLKLKNETLARGSTLYRLHCLHCHGVPGDGRGPTAPWVNPHPRDYRQGIFKFTSVRPPTEGFWKPRREDLLRTLRQGIDGTSMPAFNLLPAEDLEDLVSYVIHLSLRGETEFQVMSQLLQGDPDTKKNVTEALGFWVNKIVNDGWLLSDKNIIEPPKDYPYPYKNKTTGKLIQPGGSDYDEDDLAILRKSVQRGHEIFKDPQRGGCIGCHFDYGRQSLLAYDAWGTIIRPADLTLGVYRGGRRPIDLYRRIYSGVNGSNMAPLVVLDGESEKDRQQRIWDLVNFVQVLPYRAMRDQFGIEIDRPETPKSLK